MRRFNVKKCFCLLMAAWLLVLSLPASSVSAQVPITVSITAPSSVSAGGKFIATINISQVTALNGFQLQLAYDPSLIQVDDAEGGALGITAGLIGGVTIPVDMWTYYPRSTPGVIRLLGYVPGNLSIAGNGTLAVIHFRGVGSSSRCDIIPTEILSPTPPELPFRNNLFDNSTNIIPSTWAGTGVNLLPGPSITTASLPDGETGVFYSHSLTGSGGIQPLAWSIQSGSLPAGLSLNATSGGISGMPSLAGGPANLTFMVTDSLQATATRALTLTILPPPTIATASLLNGEVGVAYSQTLSASGGTLPYVWSIQSGVLPAGLSLNATSGGISGTPSAAGGPTTINFKVTDSLLATATKDLPITILPPPNITTASLLNGEVGVAYSQTLTASGGTLPYVWSIQSGVLPAGLSLNATSGGISGTPSTAGGPTTITFKVTDSLSATATKDLTITILPAPVITTVALPDGEVSVAYSQTLTATGGTSPLIWSIQSGALPAGLSLNATTGSVSGTPSAAGGPTPVTFKITDSLLAIGTKTLSLTIRSAPAILTSLLPNGTAGASYSFALASSGGTLPHNWSATGLPSGLAMAPSGLISGTPSTSGNFSIIVMVTDSFVPSVTKNATLSLFIYPQLQISTSALTGGVSGRSYSMNLTATGGIAPYSWNATGLPSGLTISANGTISGVPSATGEFSINLSITDSFSPANTAAKTLSIRIYMRGDATGNNLVNMGDVILVERIILGISAPTVSADASNDGIVDMSDVTVIERIILGIPI